jgi:MoaA/NifB/PqqE/SkfB family radical SAM enzyme
MTQLFLANEPIINYQHLGVATSWRCNADCAHCFVPEKQRLQGKYNRNLIDRILGDLPSAIRILSFTGGEPFLAPEYLLKEIEKVGRTRRKSTVVTNGLWLGRHVNAGSLLRKAYSAGLRTLSISCDSYHRSRLKKTEIIDLLRLARKIGLAVNIKGVGQGSCKVIQEIDKSGALIGQKDAIAYYDLDNVGNAANLPIDLVQNHNITRCSRIVYPFVTPTGDVYACCPTRIFEIQNDVLWLGNVGRKPMSDILDRSSRDYLLTALLALGPKELNKMIDVKVNLEKPRYQCELCVSLLNDASKVKEIRQRIARDRKLRKKIVGGYMIYEHCYRPGIHPLFDT